MILTNHRGDSGMKNRPGISARQGNVPAAENDIKLTCLRQIQERSLPCEDFLHMIPNETKHFRLFRI